MSGRASLTLFLVLALVLFVAVTGADWDDYVVTQPGRAALSPREHLGYALFTSGFLAALGAIGGRWLTAGWISLSDLVGVWSARLRVRRRPATAAALALAALVGTAVAPDPGRAGPAPTASLAEPPPEEGERRWQLTLTLLPDSGADGRRLMVVARPWFYCHAPTGEVFRVPAGYVTDLASVPAVVQPLAPPFGSYAEASVIHDWLYAVRHPGGRKRADLIMLHAMRDFRSERARTGAYPAWVIYKAVRLFGWRAYYFRGDREWTTRWADVGGFPPSKLALAWRGRSQSRCARFQDELDSGIYARQFERRREVLERAGAG